MRTLFLDCFSGISGDMTFGALIDLGVDEGWLIRQLRNLGLSGWELHIRSVDRNGLKALQVEILLDDHIDHSSHPEHQVHKHAHSSMEAITTILATAGIPEPAKALSLSIFQRLAEAEARIHKIPVHEVHLPEISALDSILAIVGTALCIHQLSPQQIIASVQYDGTGFVDSPQGLIPLPVPAVAELLASRHIPFRQHTFVEGELITPTGAAIISTLAESFGSMPAMQFMGIGYGAGDREYALPNVLRAVLGETLSENNEPEDSGKMILLETDIYNITPELLGYIMERMLSAGAENVYFIPLYMKKGRLATLISVFCKERAVSIIERIIFTEIHTIGVRRKWLESYDLQTQDILVNSPFGPLKAKVVTFESKPCTAIDYRDARRLAIESGIPLKKILSFLPGEKLHTETT
jgi:uncharacterized protein (TIGR00299 family) protein